MQVVHERCVGLDVHKKTVAACVITPEGRYRREFQTTTAELLALLDWLQTHGVSHAVVESTGVYWKPVFNLMEASEIMPLLVNAAHIKNVPGRKTDMKDAEWLAELLRHGLIRASFVPDRNQRELRELVRYRRSLIQEQVREANRMQKVLEGANIKLGDVTSVILGKSGRAMIRALTEGATDPEKLASLARGRLRSKHAALVQALRGVMGPHQRHMLATQLRHIEFLEAQVEGLDQEIQRRMQPYEEALERVREIPGVGPRVAEEVLAEIGLDMGRFPSSGHLASWAGMCPGNNESAGKRKSGRTRPGNVRLRFSLVQAAHAAGRTKDTYLSALYRRLMARRGRKRAAVAVGHALLVIMYHMLRNGTRYQDLGADHFDHLQQQRSVDRAVRRLEDLGYTVTLEKPDSAA